MNILICDDDPVFVKDVQHLIEQYFADRSLPAPSVYTFLNSTDLLRSRERRDLVFLDVEMPDQNGIETGKILRRETPKAILIVITSHDRYLDDAFDFGALRYLPKPVSRDRFFRSMDAALRVYTEQSTELTVKTDTGILVLLSAEIYMIEAAPRGSILYTKNSCIPCAYSLEQWSPRLPASVFFRTHRRFYVNLEHVIRRTDDVVAFRDIPYRAQLSRRSRRTFEDALLLYRASHC